MSPSDEHRAFVEILFERHRAALLRHAAGLLGSSADAEDVVQETAARLLNADGLERHEPRARSYMFRVATHLAYDRHRRRRERSLDEAEPPANCPAHDEPDAIVDLDCAVETIIRTLLQLKPRCRQVFLLRTSEGLGYEAIAERLAISTRTAEREMKRALDACQRRLRRGGIRE